MLILGLHTGHNATAALYEDYRMIAAVHLERLTRKKIDGGKVPEESIDECLNIAGAQRADIDVVAMGRGKFPSRWYTHFGPHKRFYDQKVYRLIRGSEKRRWMPTELNRAGLVNSLEIFDTQQFKKAFGLAEKTDIQFYNHHFAHALPTLFHTNWDEALLYTSDGGGDCVQYSHRVFRDETIETIYGGDECLLQKPRVDSLGLAYGYATKALGYKINRHEGKLTGLAAWGGARGEQIHDLLASHFSVNEKGEVVSDFKSRRAMRQYIFKISDNEAKEEVAAAVQQLLELNTLSSIRKLLHHYPARRIGLAGGVFGNVRLNQRIAEECDVDEVFVYPAMDDGGLAAGGVLHYLLQRDGLRHWLKQREIMETLYLGRDYGDRADLEFERDDRLVKVSDQPVGKAAELIEHGSVVAIYTNRMEYGPRALGARSIMASPTDASINDELNRRLSRTEFMPFAPVVNEDDASRVFELSALNLYAARFMTITCSVRPQWRERIPAVVHVDNTARPQVIRREWNPLYSDILNCYKRNTGIPVLINTSFNIHEEPIINSPCECADALADNRVDYVVTDNAVYGQANSNNF
ncbi:MAG: hypothetical protein OXI60_10425 [Acidiferrobacterales bacterium]|nr:hypothetical protein [Acidiferrobacterales bacterium]